MATAKLQIIGVLQADSQAAILSPGAALPASMRLSARKGEWISPLLINYYDALSTVDHPHRI